MATFWKKAFRDFWLERTRTTLVILSIALGIAAFASVLASYAILTRELDRGYLETNPASAILRIDYIDDQLIKEVLQNPEISAAEPRRVVSGQIKAGPFQWRNLILFVVKDYGDIKVSKLVPEEGSWPPAAGEILIERDAFQVAGASIGDVVKVKTTDGTEQPLKVGGRVHDVGQAQARMENIVYGYITQETLSYLGEQPYLDRLNIKVAHNEFDEDHIKRVTNDLKAAIEKRGYKVNRIEVPAPGKHPHSDLTGILLLAMSSFGLFVLVLSGILVVNLLTGIMAAQVRQIGVMKTLGATRWQVSRIYLSQSLLLGVAAIIVATPLGLLGGRALCQYLAIFLNFDIKSFSAPLWVYLLVVLVGLITPLLAALYPVWRGTGISVRRALGNFDLSHGKFGQSAIDRLVTSIGTGSLPVVFAIRNSFRKRSRFVLTLLTLAAGGVFFLTALNVRSTIISTLDRLFDSRKYDLSIVLNGPQEVVKIQQAVAGTPGILRSEGWFVSEGTFPDPQDKEQSNHDTHGAVSSGDRFTVIALPLDTQLQGFDLLEGRKLEPGDTNGIVLNSALAAKHSSKIGDEITFRLGPADTTWRVVGITRETLAPAVGYIPISFFESRHPGMSNSIRLSLVSTKADDVANVKTQLDRNLEAQGIRARSASTKADGRFAFDQHMLMIYLFLIVMSGIVAGVGGLGLATTLSLNVLERRREMGILRAIGATPAVVWRIVVVEGLVTGVLSWIIGGLLAWPTSKLLGNFLVRMLFRNGLDFSFEWSGLLIWFVISVGLSAVASFLPAWRASRSTVRESLAYE